MRLLLLVLVPFQLIAQDKYKSDNFGVRLQGYFMNPSYSELIALAHTYVADTALQHKSSAQMSMMGFFAVGFSNVKQDSADLRTLFDNDFSKNQLLQQCYDLSKHIESIMAIDKHEPGINDFYWGAFFASGEKKYVKRIASELMNVAEKDSLMLYLAGSSAKWSLCSNARQYPLVKSHLLEIREEESDQVKAEIDRLLSMNPSSVQEEMMINLKQFKKLSK